jgi:hypothetical protein
MLAVETSFGEGSAAVTQKTKNANQSRFRSN